METPYSRVYSVQCRTFKVFLDALQIPHTSHDHGIATSGNHPIAYFRRVPAYRCDYSKQLRKMVADKVRATRAAIKAAQ